jgi:hypothetical protein
MPYMPRVLCLVVSLSLGLMAAGRTSPEDVLRLSVADGDEHDSMRVFAVSVRSDGHEASFVLAANGTTRISAAFAKRCGARVREDEQVTRQTDPDGKPMFDGVATVALRLGSREQDVTATVVKDAYWVKSQRDGLLGYDVMRRYQWEVDPEGPTLTLRPPGEPPKIKPLAIVPMSEHDGAFFVKAKLRNVVEEVALVPASSYLQAGPRLQQKWDLNSKRHLDGEAKVFGDVRVLQLSGDERVELTPEVRETDLPVALVGDPKHPERQSRSDSGLGQCFLNRFVYCVEPRRQQLRLMKRVSDGAGPPVGNP